MRVTSKTKSYYERVLSKIDARSLRENNQWKCIVCLKPRSDKHELECKKCGCNHFFAPNY